MSLSEVDVGYEEEIQFFEKIHENIDNNNDRIALLGANGNGKSTLMKLIGELDPMKGNIFRNGKLRIGYFFATSNRKSLMLNQHLMKPCMKLWRPLIHISKESVVRAKLGAFGFTHTLADNKIASLSGGEKARLLFAFMSFDAPHLLLLDEPTNHLDIDARSALVNALNNYQGAIVIVSHDPNMVERVADRLWLVRNGACHHFDGDIEDYRKFMIKSKREERQAERKTKNKKIEQNVEPSNNTMLKQEKKKPSFKQKREKEQAEKKIASLEIRKQELEDIIGNPDFYAKNDNDNILETQRNYENVLADLEKYEMIWLSADEG